MVNVDTRELEELANRLERLAHTGLPHAVRNGLNRGAFAARKRWVQVMREDFTIRNTWTTRSPRVLPARGINASRMVAVLGSPLEYLAEREKGATKGTTIPTPTAAGQTGRRTRPVRRANRLSQVQLARSRRAGGSSKAKNAAAIQSAKAKKRKFVYLEKGRRAGIFRVKGSRRKIKLQLVWDLSKRSVRVKPMPTLSKTLDQMEAPLRVIYRGAILQQLKRARLQ